MAIDLGLSVISYSVFPFITAMILSLIGFEVVKRIKNRYYSNKYLIELQNHELEKRVMEQKERSNLLSDQIASLYERNNTINNKLEEISNTLKIVNNNIQKINMTSPFDVSSLTSSHVSNIDMTPSHFNHNAISLSNPQYHIQAYQDKQDERQNSTIEYILKKLENSSLTTRELQKIVGRTREHTSRIMKKLFDDNYVIRDTSSKPFRYSITDEGRKLLTKHSASKNLLPPSNPLKYNPDRLTDLVEK